VSSLLENFGGHKFAAGLTIKKENIAELQAKYEKKEDEAKILRLENSNKQKALERNRILGSSVAVVLLLILTLIFFRYRSRKNRVIAAQRIQQLEDEKKIIEAQSVMVGQERERKRIAQELHDSLGVLLSTAKIHFKKVVSKTTDENIHDLVEKADNLLKDASEEVREISHNIMPGVLSKLGLSEAIEDLLDEVEDAGKVEVNYQVEEIPDRLPENTEIMLFRVVQELVNNTLKHAEATRIDFILQRSGTHIRIEYTDNGKGFNPDTVQEDKSLGLSGIRSRIDFLKGILTIDSQPNGGARFNISIPID
jgi:signal transduction histidine kinase